nr:MAG: helix-turn-helix domain protein [Bacteriophage sp.]
MEMHERIKELRKEYLHLSQTEFGERLGVSRSVINNIERNALARPDQKLSLIKLMCSVFDVNEEWIVNGTEPMFVETPSSTMDQLKKEFNLDDFSYNLVYQYLKLDAEQRQTVRDFFYNVVETGVMDEDLFGDVPKTPEDLEKEFPPVEPERNKETG